MTNKEIQIALVCKSWFECSKRLKKKIDGYPKGTSIENKKIEILLKDISKHSEISSSKMEFLTNKLAKEAKFDLKTISNYREKKHDKPYVKKKRGGSIVFYIFLMFIVIVLSTVINGQSNNSVPKNIAGYSPMTILTKSMQRVYPQSSFVLVKVTDSKELKIGDDVTYLKENRTTVTHRIIGINENYMGEGNRGFETKGVENPRKDEEVVRAENVIGKVIFSSLFLGKTLLFIRENMLITAITVITLIYFMDTLVRTIKMFLVK